MSVTRSKHDQCEIRDCTDEAEYRLIVTDRDGGCSPMWFCEQCRSAYLMGKNEAKSIYA